MLGSLMVGLMSRPWARRIIPAAFAALTITLFLFNLRRSGERASRAAEWIQTLDDINHAQRQMLEEAAR
jgi:hypothetical protein